MDKWPVHRGATWEILGGNTFLTIFQTWKTIGNNQIGKHEPSRTDLNKGTGKLMGNRWRQSGQGRLIKQVCKQKGRQSQAREEDNKKKIKQEVKSRQHETRDISAVNESGKSHPSTATVAVAQVPVQNERTLGQHRLIDWGKVCGFDGGSFVTCTPAPSCRQKRNDCSLPTTTFCDISPAAHC